MVRKGENMSDEKKPPISADDIDWIDLPFADEGLEIAGLMLSIIKEYDMIDHCDVEDILSVFDAADICREVIDRTLHRAVRNEEVSKLEEIWELN